MEKEIQEKLDAVISFVSKEPSAELYRTLSKATGEFSELPTVSRADFLRTPLSKRRYKNEKGLVKIVHDRNGSFLSEWSFEDIGREPWGTPSKRPFVYMDDPHGAIEKALWCYENGMVPLLGERDSDIATYAAGKYQVDSLITDPVSLPKLSSYLNGRQTLLDSITVLGDAFKPEELMPFSGFARDVRLVLCLPETGPFAEAQLSENPAFHSLQGCFIEREDTLIVSKTATLVTPIIRYRTTIPVSLYDGT